MARKTPRAEKVGDPFELILTDNAEMKQLLRTARTIAPTDVSVLIHSEHGTGKELLARAVHAESRRRGKPFVAVNCSALTETLLEAELFGFEKGSFTGADRARRGYFEMAHEGTLLLDEIGDMSLSAQAKVLRAIEYKVFERIGGEESVRVDVRIIAATNKNLPLMIRSGHFREDLYFRLNEVTLELPPLRRRKEDIPPLVRHFIRECNKEFNKNVQNVSKVTMSYLLKHDWPGNVRELRNVVRRGVAMAQRDEIWLEDMALVVQFKPDTVEELGRGDLSLAAVERHHIERVLESVGGNKRRACSLLKISRPTLDRKLKDYGIDVKATKRMQKFIRDFTGEAGHETRTSHQKAAKTRKH